MERRNMGNIKLLLDMGKKNIKGNNDEHINIFKKSEILSIISYLINYFQN